jgi:DNA-binding MarR family transcriptional regulator
VSATGEPAQSGEGHAEVVTELLTVNRMFVAVATSALAGLAPDVTLPQFRTLVLLEERGAMTVTALADALGVVPSTATRMCDRLVAKKLVRRGVDRRNRRQVTIGLSGPGRALVAASTARRRRELAGVVDGLTPTDRGRVAEALRLLIAAARARERS